MVCVFDDDNNEHVALDTVAVDCRDEYVGLDAILTRWGHHHPLVAWAGEIVDVGIGCSCFDLG